MTTTMTTGARTDYDRIEQAIRYIRANADRQPGLEEISDRLNLSPFHFQRLFRRWAGISPKRFLQHVTVDHAKRLLEESGNVLDTAYEVGLSSPARLHDHFVSLEAVTPGEYKQAGAGLLIRHGLHEGPFGAMFLAATERGLCRLGFVDAGDEEAELDLLRSDWPRAELRHDLAFTSEIANGVFPSDRGPRGPLHLQVRGTNFQIAVWRALLRVPAGSLCTYDSVARAIGRPGAAQAVGNAVGANRVAYLIPCHRVIRAGGELGGYRWGTARKSAMIAWESVAEPAAAQA
jgi:AraC family transcriptional regulator of adaptative response/methylated-DNA-[protein]-cysteine methyltransferase